MFSNDFYSFKNGNDFYLFRNVNDCYMLQNIMMRSPKNRLLVAKLSVDKTKLNHIATCKIRIIIIQAHNFELELNHCHFA